MFPVSMLKTDSEISKERLSIRYQLHTCHAKNLWEIGFPYILQACAAPKEGPDFCMKAVWKKRSASFIVCATGCQGDSVTVGGTIFLPEFFKQSWDL